MATVNLLNSSWTTNRTLSGITIDVSSTYVEFELLGTYQIGRAKACVALDMSEYSTISFSYSRVSQSGITSLQFGIFDNMTPDDDSGTIILASGDFNRTNGGSISYDVSSLSGTKYVGFRFYANTDSDGDCKEKPYITSLTATEKTYTLTYNANGGSGAPSAVSDIRSTTISSTVPTRSGYDFLGWSESSSATYASYFAGNSIYLSSDMTLYAVWQKFYTITYDANGGSNAPSSDKKIDGETITVSGVYPTPPTNTSVIYTVILNATGGTCDPDTLTVTNVTTYEFINWNTKSDGSGVTYQSYDLYSDNSDITLYAQYTSTTTYNSTTLPIPSRSGYDFLGWSANEEDTSGMIGEYTPTESETTLYATWKRRGLVYICDNAGEFSAYEVFIYDGSGWNLYIPYIYTESGWIEYSG